MNYKNTWHVLHFLLTVFTGGLWSPLWLWCASSNAKHNKAIDKSIQLEQNEILKRIVRLLENQIEEN
jgi:hypothetical protein